MHGLKCSAMPRPSVSMRLVAMTERRRGLWIVTIPRCGQGQRQLRSK